MLYNMEISVDEPSIIQYDIFCIKLKGWCLHTMSAETQQSLISLAFPVLIVVFFIFAIILPQRKKDKKVKEMLNSIKKGDKVRTIGGMYGRVSSITDDTVILEVGPEKVKMPFVRGAIASVEAKDVDENDKIEAPPIDPVS